MGILDILSLYLNSVKEKLDSTAASVLLKNTTAFMLTFHIQTFTYYLQILQTQKPLQPKCNADS